MHVAYLYFIIYLLHGICLPSIIPTFFTILFTSYYPIPHLSIQ